MADNPEPDGDLVGDEYVDDVFTLGGQDRADDDSRRRSTKRFALSALAVVVVVVAVAITLVSLLVDTSGPPTSPSAAAQRWALDVVHGNRADATRLQCKDASSANVLSLILVAPTDGRTGDAVRLGPRRWTVPVSFSQPGRIGPLHANLTVVRRNGAYLVC